MESVDDNCKSTVENDYKMSADVAALLLEDDVWVDQLARRLVCRGHLQNMTQETRSKVDLTDVLSSKPSLGLSKGESVPSQPATSPSAISGNQVWWLI